MRKKQRKELVSDAKTFVGLGVGLPIGAGVVTSVGGSATSITTISGYMPMLAGVTMAKHGISALGGLAQTSEIGAKNRRKKRSIL